MRYDNNDEKEKKTNEINHKFMRIKFAFSMRNESIKI